jgi:hypothetical protein
LHNDLPEGHVYLRHINVIVWMWVGKDVADLTTLENGG